jgi:hypothetical protein
MQYQVDLVLRITFTSSGENMTSNQSHYTTKQLPHVRISRWSGFSVFTGESLSPNTDFYYY